MALFSGIAITHSILKNDNEEININSTAKLQYLQANILSYANGKSVNLHLEIREQQ